MSYFHPLALAKKVLVRSRSQFYLLLWAGIGKVRPRPSRTTPPMILRSPRHLFPPQIFLRVRRPPREKNAQDEIMTSGVDMTICGPAAACNLICALGLDHVPSPLFSLGNTRLQDSNAVPHEVSVWASARSRLSMHALMASAALHIVGFAAAWMFAPRATNARSEILLRSSSYGPCSGEVSSNVTGPEVEGFQMGINRGGILGKSAEIVVQCYGSVLACNSTNREETLLKMERTLSRVCVSRSSLSKLKMQNNYRNLHNSSPTSAYSLH
ncbi:uncharacterized protein MYCFIDRAFT_172946 [Pseudocercospora fijiensis CIRAD86]|uniref:Uncharacterized protein n=1 Tax=Pseudocercospora fijiensis (strain CIRAD86) TaxID=383855 RepID=M2ZY46_PSEFD|nr:uncharacterized protein MYCFIDRAFT_172946 [Pseudocercospora fijiensis CIRAD86]EME83874.1 hypothetical protein MYCFIDRAFT_172946 [Pseudocercospora fijiensis CIRAD86]